MPPENTPVYNSNDLVDLKELFKAIWNGKLIIMLVTALFAIISVGYALSVQEWWSSKAKIVQAQPQDITAYQQQVKQFQPVFNIYQDDGTVLVSRELDTLVNAEALFNSFINMLNSTNNKRSFFESNSDFQALRDITSSDETAISEDATRAFYSQWFGRVSTSIVDINNRNSPYVVSFQTMTKESSFDLLTAYISFTESKVYDDAFNNLKAVVNGKRNELIQQKRILESQARNQLLVESERAKYAMGIAQAAGVEKPIQVGNDNELFGIDLGAKGLAAKVQALESVKNLSVIEPRLQQINAKLDMLSNLEIDRSVEFQTFRFLENVEQPIARDKPNRALIVILGTFLGGIISLGIVLIRFLIREKD
ncbi:Wzz/FepE/Etk N-terminal domain-containing protein [Vibrio sp. 99K-1]|uniref:LPS O-antigen chain length determinant protein WzzB n=1 Tax=Vibrio sp. 99K-1 TaxID=2607603 RepID=UPI0014938FD5|nr:Wzz/FepE/Etk N-terminal domain-containing protein [Vibrio sp. 99K-1]NOI88343.1 LPS chain length-determining protein [Vibrio sp. 99K-1]